VIILQLTKIPGTYEECDTDLKKWLYLLVKMTHMGSITLVNEKKAAFKKLLKVAELTALTQEDRALYEEKVKVYRDYVNQLDYAIKEGIQKGRKEGREEGLAVGIEKGKDEGILLTASAMKSNGADIAFIVKCTGLSIGEIEKL
jgi:predicted transposase/invertase (TIGR01784 family)